MSNKAEAFVGWRVGNVEVEVIPAHMVNPEVPKAVIELRVFTSNFERVCCVHGTTDQAEQLIDALEQAIKAAKVLHGDGDGDEAAP
jgi:hypothetical protein